LELKGNLNMLNISAVSPGKMIKLSAPIIPLSVKMEHLSKTIQRKWTKQMDKVQELCSKGHSQREISQVLQVGLATVNRDISYLRNQANTNEYEKCLVGLTAITKEACNTAQSTEGKREKIHLLSLAKECYSMKLDLLTNATVVDDAIRLETNSRDRRNDDETAQESENDTELTNKIF
jgi:hypothetical protein